MGTVVMVAWFVVLGLLGTLLLSGIAYSMFVDNLEAGLICGFFLFLSLFLTLTWGAARWSEVLRKNRSQLEQGRTHWSKSFERLGSFFKKKIGVSWKDLETPRYPGFY